MSLQAVGNRIVIEKLTVESVTVSGLYVPPSARSSEFKGKIVSVGEQVKGLKADDVVFYDERDSVPVMDNGKSLLIIKDFMVLAIIKPD